MDWSTPIKIHLLTIGKSDTNWSQLTASYLRRMPPDYRIELIEIPLARRNAKTNIPQAIAQENQKLQAAIPKGSLVIALDERGTELNTLELAHKLQTWHTEYRDLCLIIGGPDGLDPQMLKDAHWSWSLSRLTMPYQLVKVLVAEQLYRAWSILHHHPYHRS